MTHVGPQTPMLIPQVVSAFADVAGGVEIAARGGANLTNANAWPAANRAYVYPVRLERAEAIKRFWCHSGNVSGNIDIGIYDDTLTKLWSSGSTAQANAHTMQSFTPSPDPLILGPGTFWVAMALDNGTGQVYNGGVTLRYLQSFGGFQMASAFPLPTTLTPATWTGVEVWLFGLATVTTF